jgi:hypothetical protein
LGYHLVGPNSRSKQLTDLGQMLVECQIFLYHQEAELEVCEVILAEELGSNLHSSDGRDLPVELDKACTIADGITDERTTEARQLSQHIMGISNVLVDLGMLPVQDIPQLPKSSREVLPAAVLVLMRWPPRPVCGTEFGTATAPVILGHLSHRSFTFPPFFLPLRMAVKDVLVYIYTNGYLLG